MLYLQLLLAVGILSAHSVLSTSFKDATAACTKQVGIDANIENMNFKDPAFSKQAKCAVACVLEKKGVLKDDGSIDRDEDKELLKEAVTEEDLLKKYLKAVDDCDVKPKADNCETAYEFVKCKETKAGVI